MLTVSEFPSNVNSGVGYHPIHLHHNTPSMYCNPPMFWNQCNHPSSRIHCAQQLKFGVIMFLSFSSIVYKTQHYDRHTSFLVNHMRIDEQSEDDARKNDIPVVNSEPDLWYLYRSQQRSVTENVKDTPIEYKSWYDSASTKITNISSYMETFRKVEFDNWGRTYDEMKKGMYSWKSRYFRELKSDGCIYESACGIGMNLYMTLEILQHTSGITNVTIYGNDFVSSSVQIAQELFSNNGTINHMLPSSFGQLGSIYEADSTKLDFIPSNTFDLVYTGYISPLDEPLDLKQSPITYSGEKSQQLTETSDTTINLTSSSTIVESAQQRQNDWYGKWVGEMIRIAKPGVPIIVEQVSYP